MATGIDLSIRSSQATIRPDQTQTRDRGQTADKAAKERQQRAPVEDRVTITAQQNTRQQPAQQPILAQGAPAQAAPVAPAKQPSRTNAVNQNADQMSAAAAYGSVLNGGRPQPQITKIIG